MVGRKKRKVVESRVVRGELRNCDFRRMREEEEEESAVVERAN